MDYEFRTFSARSFERFAQALSAHVLGPGIMIFGDGSDGAREAAYDGVLDYPSHNDAWAGYTIMQAKFLQVPKTPAEDANWLAKQLDIELAKFCHPSSKLRKPSFYILVSNAKLSPQLSTAKSKGGIDKVNAVFNKYKKRIGLQGYRIWHLDQIATLLAGADSLRRSYAAWLSPSDVIADLLADLGDRKQALDDTMFRYLTREIRTHRPLRLQQAGHSNDVVTMIDDVFTDLPFLDRIVPDPASDTLLLSHLIARSRDKLDRASVDSQGSKKKSRPERVLLLGGPGQGKSTVTQYIAQIFRANVLINERSARLPTEVAQIVDRTLQHSKNLLRGLPLPKRFPFRVDLPSFADKLSSTEESKRVSLLRFLCNDISKISDSKFDVEDLRIWLARQPSVVVLDGLDEVPPSANRSAVIRAINEFWDDVVDGDVLMIVTTRPQGYNDDLDPALYSKLEMQPLSPEQALIYAKKLADSRISDLTQRERVVARMEEAAKSETTSRIMVSPLQVAILLALIDQRGDAPSDRWSLFDKYFLVVLEREQSKSGAVGEIMRKWSRQVIALHHKAGFLLHTEAETRGNSEAYLTPTELQNLIRGQLADEEFEGEELDEIATSLTAASTERLVLLGQREEGRYSFEVRSLQEFMAAAHIMTGRESVIQARLETIANRNHWLHVFQIASSKTFAVPETEHLRDTIVTICRSLNDSAGDLDRFLKTGSTLALALLDDGLAFDQPKYRRILLNLALEILYTGPDRLPSSLNRHCTKEPDRVIEHLRHHLTSTLIGPRQSSWLLLLKLAGDGQQWALDVLKKSVPADEDSSNTIIALASNLANVGLLKEFLRSTADSASVSGIVDQFRGRYDRRNTLPRLMPYLRVLVDRTDEIEVPLVAGLGGQLSFRIVSIDIGASRDNYYNDVPLGKSWAPIQALVEFHRSPSSAALALLVKATHTNDWLSTFRQIHGNLPWPFATAVWLGLEGTNLLDVAAQIESGAFGDVSDWAAAEARWREHGIQREDLESWRTGCFFKGDVALLGAPYAGLSLTHGDTSDADWVDALLDLGVSSEGPTRSFLRYMTAFVLGIYSPSQLLDRRQLEFFIEQSKARRNERVDMGILQLASRDLLSDKDILVGLDRWGRDNIFYFGYHERNWSPDIAAKLIARLTEYPHLITLLGVMLTCDTPETSALLIDRAILEYLKDSSFRLVSDHARVFELLTGRTEPEIKSSVVSIIDNSNVSQILKILLDGDRLNTKSRIEIAEFVAAHLNLFPDFSDEGLSFCLAAVADQRLAPLRMRDSWLTLELGDRLFHHIGDRSKRA